MPERPAREYTKRVARERQALIAQMVERALGKGKVMGSNPIEGSFSRMFGDIVLVRVYQGEDHGKAEV